MEKEVSERDIQDFYNSLTPEQLDVVKQADELFANFLDERDAKRAFDEWDKAGRPRGYTLEEAREMIRLAKCN